MQEEKAGTAIIRRLEPQSLLAAAIEKGASVETLEKLLALAKDVRAEQAREAFNRAFAEFQHQCPVITKTKTAKIQGRSGGSYSYSYTPLEEITKQIVPVMTPLGLSISYRMSGTKDTVVAVAVITHELGHSKESGEVCMPVTVGGSGANPAQCVGIAATYARRYALLSVTGISPQDEDTDGHPDSDETTEQPTASPEFTAKHENMKRENGKPASVQSHSLGEEIGVVEKLSAKKNKKEQTYLVFTFNGKSVFVWDDKLFPFMKESQGKRIAATIEVKGGYAALISCRPAPEVQQEEPGPEENPFQNA